MGKGRKELDISICGIYIYAYIYILYTPFSRSQREIGKMVIWEEELDFLGGNNCCGEKYVMYEEQKKERVPPRLVSRRVACTEYLSLFMGNRFLRDVLSTFF